MPSQVNSLVKSAMEKFGSSTIDILVNNAGVAFNRKLIDTSEEEWGPNNKYQFEGCFSFYKGSSSIHDFKGVRSNIECQFWCWQGWF
jgi:NAD(P)-dependent dehydrogenase (short-subunit alcohol dehydrogenase family)